METLRFVEVDGFSRYGRLQLARCNKRFGELAKKLPGVPKPSKEEREHGVFDAIFRGNNRALRRLVEACPSRAVSTVHMGVPPLSHAARTGNAAAAAYLLVEARADPLGAEPHTGMVPLHRAAREGHAPVVRVLVAHTARALGAVDDVGAAANLPDSNRMTTLHHAAAGGCADVVRYLVDEARADPCALTALGRTALHVAAGNGRTAVLSLLAERTARVAVDRAGESPLHVAASGADVAAVAVLAAAGFDVHAPCVVNGFTPLHCAAFHGRLGTVRYLVEEWGARVDTVDRDGVTAVRDAVRRGHVAVARYLLDKGGGQTDTDAHLLIAEVEAAADRETTPPLV